jgi:hypothetical protein
LSLSSSFKGLFYKQVMADAGLLAKYMKWSYSEIMEMPVRVRRYWVHWSEEAIEMEKRLREQAQWQTHKYL